MTDRPEKRLPFAVFSTAEAETADYVICARLADDPGTFTDNHLGTCCACGEVVIFRPSAPKTPPRICITCAAEALNPN